MQTIKFARLRAETFHPSSMPYPIYTSQDFGPGHRTMILWHVSRALQAEGHPAVHQWGRSVIRSGAAVAV